MKYFTVVELTRSATARRMGIDNSPSAEVLARLEELVKWVLDPAREALGSPVMVASGYRSERVNEAVGGARGSQHLTGEAADLVPAGEDGDGRVILRLARIIREQGMFDQLILEETDERGVPRWLHVSRAYQRKQRGEVLEKRRGERGYRRL